jgi:TPR repeat protein
MALHQAFNESLRCIAYNFSMKNVIIIVIAMVFMFVLGCVVAATCAYVDLEKINKAGMEGNKSKQFILGEAYYYGAGVNKDYAEAAKWFRSSAEQGVAIAQFNLANMYAEGEGVPQDEAEAAKWYRKAAEQGLASAEYNLGNMYSSGRGVPRDEVEAQKWYRKAVESAATARFSVARSPE